MHRQGQAETHQNMKNAITAAQKIHYFLSKMLMEHQAQEQKQGLASKSQVKEVQIGMGYGQGMVCHVGGVFGRTAFFAAGEALNEAQDSLKLAKIHQGIIVSQNLWKTFMGLGGVSDASSGPQNLHNSNISSTTVHIDGYAKIDNAAENFDTFEKERMLLARLNWQDQRRK